MIQSTFVQQFYPRTITYRCITNRSRCLCVGCGAAPRHVPRALLLHPPVSSPARLRTVYSLLLGVRNFSHGRFPSACHAEPGQSIQGMRSESHRRRGLPGGCRRHGSLVCLRAHRDRHRRAVAGLTLLPQVLQSGQLVSTHISHLQHLAKEHSAAAGTR